MVISVVLLEQLGDDSGSQELFEAVVAAMMVRTGEDPGLHGYQEDHDAGEDEHDDSG